MTLDPLELEAQLGATAFATRRGLTGDTGVALPPLVDHHVHLHLIDDRALVDGGIAAVVDLGGDPTALAHPPRRALPRRSYAGAFLTAPGGYPSGRSWAPDEIVHVVSSASRHEGEPGGAETAVAEQIGFGASVIKVALNSDAGAVFDRETLEAIVDAAHDRGVPVVAHAQGPGMTRLALRAGVDVLAHTPFSEELGPRLIAAAAAGQRWISTLDIHRDDPVARATALANLTAFAAAGGSVLYGTDLGNGDLPLGLNVREIAALFAAGLDGAAVVEALTDPWPLSTPSTAIATFVPGAPPSAPDDLAAWLATADIVLTEELAHDND
ncbi:hypothetical protein ACFQZV_03415 [Microbacterium koreense]|uniref:Amidohydrolase n=1 Tax=Microbacterium koreense TaxID=323761 RepID=A0ABW2ZPQ3_9MICO